MARLFSRDQQPTELELRLREQDRQASVLLVEADEQVRDSGEELDFQRAAVGEYETQPFVDALAQARAMLGEAFRLRQLLDDHIPDSDAERDQWTRRIQELARSVLSTLAAQGEAFARLRAIGQNIPATVRVVGEQLAELNRRRERACAIVDRLRERFATSIVDQAADDLAQSQTMLNLAGRALEAAERRLGTGVQEGAPDMVDAARTAMARADKLLDSLEAREGDLVTAQVDLTEMQGRAEELMAEALKTLDADGPDQLAAIARLTELLDELGSKESADPFADAARLRTAAEAVEAPLLSRRSEAMRRDSARAALPGYIRQACDYIQWTEDFAASRRTTLGPEARTRLSEAQRHVQLAQSEADPDRAIGFAQRASQLATEAWNIAHADVERANGAGPDAKSGLGSGLSPDGKTVAIAAAAGIGGMLLGSLGGRGFGLGVLDIGDIFD